MSEFECVDCGIEFEKTIAAAWHEEQYNGHVTEEI